MREIKWLLAEFFACLPAFFLCWWWLDGREAIVLAASVFVAMTGQNLARDPRFDDGQRTTGLVITVIWVFTAVILISYVERTT